MKALAPWPDAWSGAQSGCRSRPATVWAPRLGAPAIGRPQGSMAAALELEVRHTMPRYAHLVTGPKDLERRVGG